MKQLPGVKCHIQDQTISRSGLVWISTDGNETVAASNCPYNYCNTSEDPDSQCNFNHSGTLCGGCQPGLSLALGTNQCLHCPSTHISLLLPFALAGVVLVCFIKVLDLTISQGTLNGLVFYANVVKANEYLLYNENPLAVFIAWLNLDLGLKPCFFNGLTAYGKTWLQFLFPLYIWSIAGLIIILAKYSDRVAKVMGNNSVPVLATLFLLSYAKLLNTIITALSFTMLSATHGSKAVWSADGNLDYLGPEHAPLFAVAAATAVSVATVHTPPLLRTVVAQVQLSPHHSHDDEDKAFSGCPLWPFEWQPSLLVWGSSSSESCHFPDISTHSCKSCQYHCLLNCSMCISADDRLCRWCIQELCCINI